MKKFLLRWLMPLVLAFGVAGSVAAGGQVGQGHGGGGVPLGDKGFAHVFLGDAGESFAKVVNFKISDVSSLLTLKIASIGLEDLSFSIFNKKSIEVYDSGSFGNAAGGVWTDSLNLSAGKYFAIFSGTITSAAAGYVGTLSAAPVPEPAEWMMILAGMAMMGFVVVRRRNS